MRPGGRAIESLQTDAPGQLEIKPNQPDRAHRWLNGEKIRVLYGDQNAVDSFYAANASTRTEKPVSPGKEVGKDGKPAPPLPPALTWSDELSAKFAGKSDDLVTLEQKGNFRYAEGQRHAKANSAFLQQLANRITLTGDARVWDDTGTTTADKIVLNQQNGDMDALGQVASTREPDQQHGSQNTSLLDQHHPLQARADKMKTRDNNLDIIYDGHAVLWQGADRLEADLVEIDRDAETIHATGHVVSQLVSYQADDTNPETATVASQPVRLQQVVNTAPKPPATAAQTKKEKPVVYTVVNAPEMLYRDDQRLADYTGGVEMVHDKTTVVSNELRAFLTKDDQNQTTGDTGTSLDHAFADGKVRVTQAGSGRSRTGLAEHCEYFPKDNKMVLNGGGARMLDTRKGTTVGRQLTYWSDSDHVLVEGDPKSPVMSDMQHRH
jgi:lipopolysaccharide export system protein LptA